MTTTTFNQTLFDAAQDYLRAGLSLIPVSAKDKRPREDLLPFDPDLGRGSWKVYQTRHASEAELRHWIEHGAQIAVVCGAISGNLLVLDIDEARLEPAWRNACATLLVGVPHQLTGGGGYQYFFRAPRIGANEKLAWVADANEASGRRIAIETRGEGGYVVVPPSLHPNGKHYQMLHGKLWKIRMLDQAAFDALIQAARKLDEAPYTTQQLDAMHQAMQQKQAQRQSLNGVGSIIDAYNTATSIEDVLQSYGYRPAHSGRWARPGGANASVTIKDGKSFHHSSNDPLSDGKAHDAFDLFCFFEHAGDVKAATKAAATLLCIPFTPQPAPAPAPNQSTQSTQNQTAAPVNHLIDKQLSDVGNAECFELLHGSGFRYCHTRKTWFVWDGQRWSADHTGQTYRAMVATARERYQAAAFIPVLSERARHAKWAVSSESNSKLTASLQAASNQQALATTIEQYDRDTYRASTASGTLDLRAGQLQPSQQADYVTMQLGAAHAAGATCPRWLQFLNEVFAGDTELISYLQRAVGYSLTGDTSEQKLFLLHGEGANGKSIFLKILELLLGEYAANASFETFDANRRSEATNDLAMLRAKRLVTIIETNEDRRLDEARVKAVTGGDSITCRFLYGEYFTYQPQFKIWLAMNHKPIIRNTDRGIWRRIVLVPFLQSFEHRRDPHLLDKLKQELPGILNWALAGLHAWQATGVGTCKVIEDATEQYRRESDELGEWLQEETIEEAGAGLSSADGYAAYNLWARNRGERYPKALNVWGRMLGERGYQPTRKNIDGKKVTVYAGLRLRTEHDTDTPASTSAAPAPEQTPLDTTPPPTHDELRCAEVEQHAKNGEWLAARKAAGRIRNRTAREEAHAWINNYNTPTGAPDVKPP